MGLYIKGLRLPKKGRYTSFTVYSDGRVVYKFGGDHAGQAVEVPAHGRLIDADALIDDIRRHSESYFADDFAHEWVDKAPTIIPAEEET